LPDGVRDHYERHRPEQTALYCLVQQHAATFFAQTEAGTGSALPRFAKDEFDAFLECGILGHGFLRLSCGQCGHGRLLAFSCKRRGFCPSCGARRMSQTAAHLVVVDHLIPHVPVRQWVLSLPTALRVLLAARPERVTPALQAVQRGITHHLQSDAGLRANEGQGGAVTLIQRFGSAANLEIHLHCLVLDGVYRCGADGAPHFVAAGTPADDQLHALLQTIIARLMKLLTALTYRIAFGPRAGQKVLTLRGALPHEAPARQPLCADIDGFSLHAAVRVHAHERKRLEQLCRYIARPALSEERIRLDAAGQVQLELGTPWRDGTTHLVMSPLEFMQRLAALVAREHGRPFEYLSAKMRKEDAARKIAEREGIEEGLVCVFSTLEPCRTFSLRFTTGQPYVQTAKRHARIDKVFIRVGDLPRAQRLADRFTHQAQARHQLRTQSHGYDDVPARTSLPERLRRCHALDFFARNQEVTARESMRPARPLAAGDLRHHLRNHRDHRVQPVVRRDRPAAGRIERDGGDRLGDRRHLERLVQQPVRMVGDAPERQGTLARAARGARAGLRRRPALILVPLMAWWFAVTLWQALVMEAALVIFFLVYTYIFNWVFDHFFGLPASAQAGA